MTSPHSRRLRSGDWDDAGSSRRWRWRRAAAAAVAASPAENRIMSGPPWHGQTGRAPGTAPAGARTGRRTARRFSAFDIGDPHQLRPARAGASTYVATSRRAGGPREGGMLNQGDWATDGRDLGRARRATASGGKPTTARARPSGTRCLLPAGWPTLSPACSGLRGSTASTAGDAARSDVACGVVSSPVGACACRLPSAAQMATASRANTGDNRRALAHATMSPYRRPRATAAHGPTETTDGRPQLAS